MRAEIRAATARDADAITALVRRAYAHYVPRIGQEPMPMLEDYPALIRDGDVRVLVAGEAVAGVLVLERHDGHLLIDNVAVDPAHQGRGHGAALLAHAEATARAWGIHELRLFTNAAMVENIARYAALGYVETHRATEHGRHRVFMSKTLAPT